MAIQTIIVDLDGILDPRGEKAADLLMEYTTSSFSEVEVIVNGVRRTAVEVMIYYLEPEDDEIMGSEKGDIVDDVRKAGLTVLENFERVERR